MFDSEKFTDDSVGLPESAFTRHGLAHISPSSINQFCRSPSLWLMQLAGIKNEAGIPAFWRGNAVDKAVGEYLLPTHHIPESSDGLWTEKWHGTKKDGTVVPIQLTESKTDGQLLELGYQVFDLAREKCLTEGIPLDEEKCEKERSKIERYMVNALGFYKTIKDKPTSKQDFVKVFLPSGSETWTEGDFPIPVLGYIDLTYEKAVRDTKTLSRQEKTLNNANAMQLSFYSKATGKDAFVDNIGVNDALTLRVDDPEAHLSRMYKALATIQKFLELSDDPYELMKFTMPDLDAWAFDDFYKEKAVEIWG